MANVKCDQKIYNVLIAEKMVCIGWISNSLQSNIKEIYVLTVLKKHIPNDIVI